MTISVDHVTRYIYPKAVDLAPHLFRLRPRMTTTQWLLSYDLQISPEPAGTTECLDQDGNLALSAWFNTPAQELSAHSRFSVELLRNNPFDFVVSDPLTFPVLYPWPLSDSLAPYRNDAHVAYTVKLYAASLAAGNQSSVLSFLTTLNQDLANTCKQVVRPEGAPWTSDFTLELREGSCRDLTVLFCDACRSVGIAARFVSGYQCASAGDANAYMHAWAEAYLPGVGWRGYDPSSGLVQADSHVAVAAAFHYDLASPIAGTYYGGSGARMETSLVLKVHPESAQCPSPASE